MRKWQYFERLFATFTAKSGAFYKKQVKNGRSEQCPISK